MTTGKRAARSQVKEMMDGFEFLMQLTAAEQAQLMSWLEELVSKGQIEIDHAHPLASAFDSLARYISHQTDDLPITAAQCLHGRDADAKCLNQS